MNESITFTITCGGRLDLFCRTMETFLQRCRDVSMITRWLACDDGSAPGMIEDMRRRYPQIEFETAGCPGQAASLNNLFGRVLTEWVCHWEDDWETIRTGHFLRDALALTQADDRIRNVVFRDWRGVYIREDDLEYRGHVYYRAGTIEVARARNDWCWRGWSLNPGLQHLPTLREIGPFDESIRTRYFDRRPAEEYAKGGYLRANLMEGYVKHIGEDQPRYHD